MDTDINKSPELPEIPGKKQKMKMYVNEDYTLFDVDEYESFSNWEKFWMLETAIVILLAVIDFLTFIAK